MTDVLSSGKEPNLTPEAQEPEAFRHVLNEAVPGAILEAGRDGLVVAPAKLLTLAASA